MKQKPFIAIVMKGYPRLSETFIAQEFLNLQEAGFDFMIVALKKGNGSHALHEKIKAPVLYLPEYLYKQPLRLIKALLKVRFLKQGCANLNQQLHHDLKQFSWVDRMRRWGQAVILAAELPPHVTHLYNHFIHTPGTVTFYTSLLRQIPWSFSAHAKDIWTSSKVDLKQKIAHANWGATCTKQGFDYLNALVPGKMHLIYHGLDFDRVTFLPPRKSEADGSNTQKPVILISVGRMVFKKGFDDLIKAFSMLPQNVHYIWHHYGGGDLEQDLKKRVQDFDLNEKIIFHGAQNHNVIMRAYESADLFVLPSKISTDGDRDGIPNVLMEAHAKGVCVLSSELPSIEELIIHEKTGFLTQPDNAKVLSEALLMLIQNPEKRFAYASAAQHHLKTHFDAKKTIQDLIKRFMIEA